MSKAASHQYELELTAATLELLSLSDYELMECIERGLNRFGPAVKYTVMWRMVVLGKAPKQGILVNPSAFREALKSIFGSSSNLIELAVVDEIKGRAGPDYSEINNLEELIVSIRKERCSIG